MQLIPNHILPGSQGNLQQFFPHEILASRNYLEEVKQGLSKLHDKSVLLLWGDADNSFKAAEYQRFELIFSQHKTVILKGAKHFVQEDAPEKICNAILAFENDLPKSL